MKPPFLEQARLRCDCAGDWAVTDWPLLQYLRPEWQRSVCLHPDSDFVEHVDCLINRVAVTLPQKASQRCQPPGSGKLTQPIRRAFADVDALNHGVMLGHRQ